MNTLEIDHVLKTHPSTRNVFKGVYTRNRLPSRVGVPSAVIENTDPDDRPGTHWVALYIDANSRGEYYDPKGRPPFLRAYLNFMNKHCTSWTYNTIRVQEEGSTVCEHNCIFYLIHKRRKIHRRCYENIETSERSHRHSQDFCVSSYQ
jgi:hypothetical protein